MKTFLSTVIVVVVMCGVVLAKANTGYTCDRCGGDATEHNAVSNPYKGQPIITIHRPYGTDRHLCLPCTVDLNRFIRREDGSTYKESSLRAAKETDKELSKDIDKLCQ